MNLHLSYEEFKDFYGDLGITYWTKYNYLDLDYVGKYNVWDEDWEQGVLDANGENEPSSNQIRAKNFIDVIPSKKYYISSSGTYNVLIAQYDASKTQIVQNVIQTNNPFVVATNCVYIRFHLSQAYGNTYHNDVRIYQPVMDLARDPLADFAYSYDSALERFYSSNLVGVVKVPSANTVKANIYCRFYRTNDYSSMTLYDDVIAVSTSGIVWIKDTTYNTVLSFKEGMKNESVYIVYEKA